MKNYAWLGRFTIGPTIQNQFGKNKIAPLTTGEKSCPPQHKKILFLPKSDLFVELSYFGDGEQRISKRF